MKKIAKIKLLFIVNPNSGVGNKRFILNLINALPSEDIQVDVQQTTHPDHATALAQYGIQEGFDRIVAVGGDGTVNEIAKALIHTGIPLGIIPSGSGNGLARHLGIPLEKKKAMKRIVEGQVAQIDVCYLNQAPFFCTAGVGFDADVGKTFKTAKTRGWFTYVWHTFKLYMVYAPREYRIRKAGREYAVNAFTITLANANQYGNNVFISPLSDIQDGKMELCVVKPFPKTSGLRFFLRLFLKRIHTSSYYEVEKVEDLTVIKPVDFPYHLDGETIDDPVSELHFSIEAGALAVVC